MGAMMGEIIYDGGVTGPKEQDDAFKGVKRLNGEVLFPMVHIFIVIVHLQLITG